MGKRNLLQSRDINSSSTAVEIHNFPEEIIEEILSRLPVKSLLKFRCVSKSWRSLIGSKRFIKTHLQNSTNNASFTHHRIVFLDSYPQTLRHASLRSLLNEPVIDTLAFDYPMYTLDDPIRLVGCCDGLISILMGQRQFFLWNPSTRTYKALPDVDEGFKHPYVTQCGFGFDESNSDYKAVGKIYSLKTNSWKTLMGLDVDSFVEEGGKLVSGKLHWERKSDLNNRIWDIVSFDLKSEVYGIVDQPNYREGKYHPSLGVLGGCICVLCDYKKICVDVWVMKEYGVRESWVKVLVVPYPCDHRIARFSTPFFIGSQGEILFMYGLSFAVYYPKDKIFRRHRRIHFAPFSEANVYVESLVSLVPDVEHERQTQSTA
ncbi:hypothetical protein DH2020_010659 [Rehmannia glutinosa]|uniref:F-box domain-containing protein n=1 Tax=Rehmannia glutinosa TaxID=99300 RepID=A0ABR0XBB4_REHGL